METRFGGLFLLLFFGGGGGGVIIETRFLGLFLSFGSYYRNKVSGFIAFFLKLLRKQGFRVYRFLFEVIMETRFQGLSLSFGSYYGNKVSGFIAFFWKLLWKQCFRVYRFLLEVILQTLYNQSRILFLQNCEKYYIIINDLG